MVESCSKKVAASSVWVSLNTFSAASGDFAKAAETFLPLIPTKLKKAKWTVICVNLRNTFCCRLLITNQQRQTGLSTAGVV